MPSEGIDAEVIDVRCLVPARHCDDRRARWRRPHGPLIVEEDNLTGGWGAEVAAELAESSFFDLDAPLMRIAAPDTPLPCSTRLESAYVPSVEKIVLACRRLLG